LTQKVVAENSSVQHSGAVEKPFSEEDEPIVRVADVMTRDLISVGSEKSVIEAARTMTRRRVSSVLVLRGGELCGIITDHDIISKAVAKGVDPKRIQVAELMSSPLITISGNVAIEEAAKKMAAEGVRRLAVEQDHNIIGIIGESDVVRIDPELHLLIRERSKLKATKPSKPQRIILAGYCEECGNYSSRLRKVDGKWIDEDCSSV
jgi:signal-transduction protein with cAMP-binding, CBS, and nucleotidyltransferase domain